MGDQTKTPADLSPEKLTKAINCINKIADACNGFDRTTVLIALENAYLAEVILASPTLGELLRQTLDDYKRKALVILPVIETIEQASEGIPRDAN